MSKICLRDVAERQTGWFCDDCGERILGVAETIFSRPLIDKCPHCGVVFSAFVFLVVFVLFYYSVYFIIAE